jgi:phthiodiolone/phenolphthiodiolone dimycocerosates ketoreductase
VPDHLNSLFPRSICTPKYMGAAKLAPSPDTYLEPWTMLGYLAAHNRGRMRLGVSVTDTARRNPAVTAQAAATRHLLTRGRAILGIGTDEREGDEPYGVDRSRPVARFEEAPDGSPRSSSDPGTMRAASRSCKRPASDAGRDPAAVTPAGLKRL